MVKGMIVDVTVSAFIAASPARVFEWLTDLDRMPLWSSGLLEVKRRGKMQPGIVFETRSNVMGQVTSATAEVRSLTPERELELINNTGAILYRAVYRLIPSDDQTELILWCQIEPRSRVFQLARPLIESLAATRLQADMNMLKALIEQAAQ